MCKAASLRRLIIFTCLVIGFFTPLEDAVAETPEYELKASFLRVFGDVVKWENDPGLGTTKPLSIGILGQDPFNATLTSGTRINYLDQKVAERVRAGKKIEVQRFATPDEYQPCHMLFVASNLARDAQAWQAVVKATQDADVLVVADTPGLARKGATINMVVVRGHVQLEINPDAAQRASLDIPLELYRFPGVKVVRDQNP